MMRSHSINPIFSNLPYELLLRILSQLGFLDWIALITTNHFFKTILSESEISDSLWEGLIEQYSSYFYEIRTIDCVDDDTNLNQTPREKFINGMRIPFSKYNNPNLKKDEIQICSMIFANDDQGIKKYQFATPFNTFMVNHRYQNIEDVLTSINNPRVMTAYYERLLNWYQNQKSGSLKPLLSRIGIVCDIDPDKVCSQLEITDLKHMRHFNSTPTDLINLAAKLGRLAWVKKLRSSDYKIPAPYYDAAVNGQLNILNYLIEQNADINEVDSSGFTALFYAIVNPKNNFIIQYLINAGYITLNQNCTLTGVSLFFRAVETGNIELAKWLANEGSDINQAAINNYGKENITPLANTVARHTYLSDICPMIEFLIALPKIDINRKFSSNLSDAERQFSPLSIACFEQKYDRALLLINKNAIMDFDDVRENDPCDFFKVNLYAENLCDRVKVKKPKDKYNSDEIHIAFNHSCLIAFKNAYDYFLQKNLSDEALAVRRLFEDCAKQMSLSVLHHLEEWQSKLQNQKLMGIKQDDKINFALHRLFENKMEVFAKSELGRFIEMVEGCSKDMARKYNPVRMVK